MFRKVKGELVSMCFVIRCPLQLFLYTFSLRVDSLLTTNDCTWPSKIIYYSQAIV